MALPNRATCYAPRAVELGFTLSVLEGRTIVLEGVPCVGKTTLLKSLGSVLCAAGVDVVLHEEARDDAVLNIFASDPKANAFWFQLFKLQKRKAICQQLEHESARSRTIHIIDRSLPGDLAFALYHHKIGNISDSQLEAYVGQFAGTTYRTPFLTLYLTAEPETLECRVRARGIAWEIEAYDAQYFRDMHECHIIAFKMLGCPYAIVDWNTHLVEAANGEVLKHDIVVHTLEHALATAYPENIDRLVKLPGTEDLVACVGYLLR
jgi:deoxyadenosine/deoxycytidine kinase